MKLQGCPGLPGGAELLGQAGNPRLAHRHSDKDGIMWKLDSSG